MAQQQYGNGMAHEKQQPIMGQQQYGNGMAHEKQEQPMGQQQQHQPIEYHQQPQQATAYEHANKLPSKWQFGLFDCFSPIETCCLATWCPCVVFGKIHARERGEKDPSGINGMCFGHCALLYCGMSPILQCINRGNMKDKYGMESNIVTDILTACCCGCCELIQEDKESIIRQTGMNPKTHQPYSPPADMKYP